MIGETENFEIAELCKRSSSDCGSIFMDMRFGGLVKVRSIASESRREIKLTFIIDASERPPSAS